MSGTPESERLPVPVEPVEAEIVDEQRAPVTPPTPASAPAPAADYDEHGVPSFDYVRDKIESRYATSVGAGELAAETAEGRTLDQQVAEREKAAAERLAEIRRSLGH